MTEFTGLHFCSFSLRLAVCLHCCFSHSRTKASFFFAVLGSAIWGEAAGADESRRRRLGLTEPTAERREAAVSSKNCPRVVGRVKGQELERNKRMALEA